MKTSNLTILMTMGLIIMQTGAGFASPKPQTTVTITDIKNWRHPVKDVFARNAIIISRLDLMNNRTYPVFWVSLPHLFRLDSIEYYRKVFQETIAANAFWDFELKEDAARLSIVVRGDRRSRALKAVLINGKMDEYDKLLQMKRDRVMDYLNKNVPEIAAFGKMLADAAKTGGEKSTLIYRWEGEPDAGASDDYGKKYYELYVGENLETHTSRWNTFLVHQDLKEILVSDILSGRYISLAQWRKTLN
jgi:hypothetical protein